MSATETEVQLQPCNGTVKPTVKMEGYLEKKGKMRVVSMWKRYWFVLEGRLLLYYKSQQEYTRLSPCRGSLNMGLASCVRPGPGPDRDDGHVLEVVLRAHVVTLRAKDRVCQEQWLKALLDSMALPSVTSPAVKDSSSSKGPLHFRYPSADNLNTPEKNQSPALSGREPRREKHRTLPHWKRGGEEAQQPQQQDRMVMAPPRNKPVQSKLQGKQEGTQQPSLAERRGSILPILAAEEPHLGFTPRVLSTKEAVKKQLSYSGSVASSVILVCDCKRKSFHEEEKENLLRQQHHHHHVSLGDENQNLHTPCNYHQQHQHRSDRDLLLSSLALEKPPLRCTSADELRSIGAEEMDVEYFSAAEMRGSRHRQRFVPHGDGEYVKYSEPEDCDKRDSTFNTIVDGGVGNVNGSSIVNAGGEKATSKPCKIRLRKRKGSTAKESYSYNLGEQERKREQRAPLRNRLSFLSRVLSHVRRSRPDHHDQLAAEDELLSDHPDMHTRCSTTTAAHLLTEVKKMDDVSHGSDAPIATLLTLGPADIFPTEAPEEPPPDYDCVNMDSLTDVPPTVHPDEPPQLPPRRMKRPRSPWHDVPTNNSPVVDMDVEARQRLLSAAKYGRVIGTRGSCSMELYDLDIMNADDLTQHHAYEVVSDNSQAGSNEHLAIYLSSESSDDEFHEEVVLRRNIKDNEFLYGSEGCGKTIGGALMRPLTIHTQNLPTLDSSGRVSLSHIEAVKLSLLMQAQKATSEFVKMKQKEELQNKNVLVPDFSYETNGKLEENIQGEKSIRISEDDYVREPPAEFADRKYILSNKIESVEKVSEVVSQGLLVPCGKQNETSLDENEEEKSKTEVAIGKEMDTELRSEQRRNETQANTEWEMSLERNMLTHDSPPQLPVKSKNLSKSDSFKLNRCHSNDLNTLLAQLANMTTAPLLPFEGTCSLQVVRACKNDVDPERKQSLSLDAMVNSFKAEPDYDIPRPHTSLLHLLIPKERHQSEFSNIIDNGVVERASFSSGQESPLRGLCLADDQCWSGHMSPDSLDSPLSMNRIHPGDVHSTSIDELSFVSLKKPRGKKDRSRRATLNGPITEPCPSTCLQNFQQAPLVCRNSVEVSAMDITNVWFKDKNHAERRTNEPKHMSLPTSCEHDSLMSHPQRPENSPYVVDLCKKFELSASLEDISERSELEHAESLIVKPISNCIQSRTVVAKGDDVDMDSLEITELKRLDISEHEPSSLVSIIEECDVNSERSEKSERLLAAFGVSNESSESVSERALICEEGSESRATDEKTNHSTDTDMDMSDDEVNDKMEEDATLTFIEPDSLLHETIVAVKCSPEPRTVVCTKDASLEADSLELKT